MTAPPSLDELDRDHPCTPAAAEAAFRGWYTHERYRPAMLGANGKRPWDPKKQTGLEDWNSPQSLDYLKGAARAALNLGIRTGDFPVGDIDCPNPRVADAVEAAIAAELGLPVSALSVCWRRDSAKIKIIFALKPGATPFKKMSVTSIDPNSEKQMFEFLGDGQQGVVAGVHADTGAPLQIRGPHPADIGPEKMIEIDEPMARRILSAVADAMIREGCISVGMGEWQSKLLKPRERRVREDCNREQWLCETALEPGNILKWAQLAFPGGHASGGGWRVGPDALGRESEEDLAIVPEGIQDWGQEFEHRVPYTAIGLLMAFGIGIDKDGELILVTEFGDNHEPIGGVLTREEAIAWLCTHIDFDWEAEGVRDDALAQCVFDDDFSANYTKEHPELAPPPKSKGLSVTPFLLGSAALIKPREHLYGRHLTRRFVSGTFAPGGSGKSSNAMAEAVAMAANRDLFGIRPVGPLCVLYANGEDPQDENLRKAAAVCRYYGVTTDELGGRLHLLSGRDNNLILAKSGRDGVLINQGAFAELRRVINEIQADVVMLDPIVGFHRLVENDNTAMGALCYALARLAEETNCAIELEAHTRKMGLKQTEIGVDDGRGASAVVAAMRSARVFNRMSAEEADKAGIHPGERWRYSRIDNGKSNLAPPEKTVWRKMVSVPLWNGPDGSAGDEVGVTTAWQWPDRAGGSPKRKPGLFVTWSPGRIGGLTSGQTTGPATLSARRSVSMHTSGTARRGPEKFWRR